MFGHYLFSTDFFLINIKFFKNIKLGCHIGTKTQLQLIFIIFLHEISDYIFDPEMLLDNTKSLSRS